MVCRFLVLGLSMWWYHSSSPVVAHTGLMRGRCPLWSRYDHEGLSFPFSCAVYSKHKGTTGVFLLHIQAFFFFYWEVNGERDDLSNGNGQLKMFVTKIVPRNDWMLCFGLKLPHKAVFSLRQEWSRQHWSLLPQRVWENVTRPAMFPRQCDVFLYLCSHSSLNWLEPSLGRMIYWKMLKGRYRAHETAYLPARSLTLSLYVGSGGCVVSVQEQLCSVCRFSEHHRPISLFGFSQKVMLSLN